MSNKTRKNSARIILFVYLTSLVSVTLFHYHGNDSLDNEYYGDKTVKVSHQSTGERNSDVDQCSLCLITNVQFDAFSNTILTLNNAESQLLVIVNSYLTVPFINYSPKRAPPVIS